MHLIHFSPEVGLRNRKRIYDIAPLRLGSLVILQEVVVVEKRSETALDYQRRNFLHQNLDSGFVKKDSQTVMHEIPKQRFGAFRKTQDLRICAHSIRLLESTAAAAARTADSLSSTAR